MDRKKAVYIIDAQGGGIGKQLVAALKKRASGMRIIAVGTNSSATTAMLGAGADVGATGENAVITACRKADVIAGPIGIIIADSMYGEVTPRMAVAVGQSSARKVLIPFRHDDRVVVGVSDQSMKDLIAEAAEEILRSIE